MGATMYLSLKYYGKILTSFTSGQLHVLYFNFLTAKEMLGQLTVQAKKRFKTKFSVCVCVCAWCVFVCACTHMEARTKAGRCSLEPPLRQGLSLRPGVYYQASRAGQASSLVTHRHTQPDRAIFLCTSLILFANYFSNIPILGREHTLSHL